MARKKDQTEVTDEAAAPEATACGSGKACSGDCGPRTVPVEDVVVGVIRLTKDILGNVGGLGAAVAPGLKTGVADLSNAAGQGLKRVIDLVGKGFKKPVDTTPDEPAH
ncbi:MAG: hypothetical protein HQL44_09635 [Alphaproteobacteria bacterium]|nr:hypothetical protein [Alphaproteobacteria bacterium]